MARTLLVEAGSECRGERGERHSSLPEEAGVEATEQHDKCPQTARPKGNPPCPSIHMGLHTGLEQPLSRLPAARTVNSRSCPALLESGCWTRSPRRLGDCWFPRELLGLQVFSTLAPIAGQGADHSSALWTKLLPFEPFHIVGDTQQRMHRVQQR